MSLRAKKTARKKEEILQSALIVLAQKGYHGTTMEDIASHLFMTKGSLYYYFKNKQELVYESQIKLLNKSIENVKQINKTSIPSVDKLKKFIDLHITFLIENKSGFELMARPEEIFATEQLKEIYQLREIYAEHYDNLLERGKQDGSFCIRENEVKIVRNLILGAMNWMTQWHSSEASKPLPAFVEAITQYLLRLVTRN